MPLVMKVGRKRRDAPTKLDEELTQSIFMSWCFKKNGIEVVRAFEKKFNVKLGPLRRVSEGIYDVDAYLAACDGEVDRPTAEEAVERSRAAWQKPKPLLIALETFLECLDKPGAAKMLEPTGYAAGDHREVVTDLIARVKKAIERKASSVCLEGDACLI